MAEMEEITEVERLDAPEILLEAISESKRLHPELQKRLDYHKNRPFPEGTRFEWVPLSEGFPKGYEAKKQRGKKSGLRFLEAARPTRDGELYQLFAIVPQE